MLGSMLGAPYFGKLSGGIWGSMLVRGRVVLSSFWGV